MRLLRSLVVLLTLLLLPSQSYAGDRALVMFGSDGCVYCKIFKREVAPNYRWSKAAKKAPLSEINLTKHGTAGYSLKRRITVTPTFVMFKRGREVARIPGYPGKKSFYKMVDLMIKRAR